MLIKDFATVRPPARACVLGICVAVVLAFKIVNVGRGDHQSRNDDVAKSEYDGLRGYNSVVSAIGRSDFRQAIDAADRSVAFVRVTFGKDDSRLPVEVQYQIFARDADALPMPTQALLSEMCRDSRDSVDSYNRMDLKRAKEKAESAVKILERPELAGKSWIVSINLWNDVGWYRANSSDEAGSLEAYSTALHVAEELLPQNHWLRGQGHANFGSSLLVLGDISRAVVHLEEGFRILSIPNPIVSPQDRGTVELMLADALMLQAANGTQGSAENFAKSALEHFVSALNLVSKDANLTCRGLYGLASIYRLQGAVSESIALCDDVIKGLNASMRADGSEASLQAARFFHLRGVLRWESGDFYEAERDFLDAIFNRSIFLNKDKLFRINDLRDCADTLSCLGGVETTLGHTGKAELNLVHASDIYQDCLNRVAAAVQKHNFVPADLEIRIAIHEDHVAGMFRLLGRFDKSTTHYVRSLTLLRKHLAADDKHIAKALNNLGVARLWAGDFEGAAADLDASIAIYERRALDSDGDLYKTKMNIGLNDILRNSITQRTADFLKEASNSGLAQFLRLAKSQTESEQFLSRAMAVYSTSLWLKFALATNVSHGDIYDEMLPLKGAITLRGGLREDGAHKVGFSKLRDLGTKLIALAYSTGNPERVAVETGKVKLEYDALERELIKKEPQFAQLLDRFKMTGKGIRAALEDGECLVDFHEYPTVEKVVDGDRIRVRLSNEIGAFVVRAGDVPIEFVPLGKSSDFAKMTANLHEALVPSIGNVSGSMNRGVVKARSVALKNRIWDRIRKSIGSAEMVFLSTDGPLNLVPFGLLPGDEEEFLALERAFVVVLIPSLLPEIKKRQRQVISNESKSLLVGAIDYGRQGIISRQRCRIPNAWSTPPSDGAEIDSLRSILEAKSDVTALRGAEAEKDAILKGSHEKAMIHLSGHTLILQQKSSDPEGLMREIPMRAFQDRIAWNSSGFLCAGINTAKTDAEAVNRCIISNREMAMNDMRDTEIVSFSSCNTARGFGTSGEGTLGPHRAMMIAGVKTIIASLWEVDSEESRVFMTTFYRHFASGQRAIDAFRAAQKEAISNASTRSFSWAAFSLFGDWR